MTPALVKRIIESTAEGWVRIHTADNDSFTIDPEVMEWEVMEAEGCLHYFETDYENWVNIDTITKITR